MAENDADPTEPGDLDSRLIWDEADVLIVPADEP